MRIELTRPFGSAVFKTAAVANHLLDRPEHQHHARQRSNLEPAVLEAAAGPIELRTHDSEREDSNLQPPGPKPGALPLSHALASVPGGIRTPEDLYGRLGYGQVRLATLPPTRVREKPAHFSRRYRRQDSNLHATRHWFLRPACLPIPPLRRIAIFTCQKGGPQMRSELTCPNGRGLELPAPTTRPTGPGL